MFDSPFDDWMPGLPGLFGWPWHGRIDLPLRFNDFQPRLTMPNGRVIRLPSASTLPSALRRHQAGNVLRYRSPAATAGDRTPEQLAADQAVGREWRADVLFNPRQSWVYGQQLGLYPSMVTWPYACLINDRWETRYVSFFGVRDVRLTNAPNIRRAYGAATPFQNIQAQLPQGSPVGDLDATWVVMDQVPDGSKVILARFSSAARLPLTHIDGGGEGAGDWCDCPVEYWELALSTSVEGVHSAALVPLRTREQTAGELTPRVADTSRKNWRPWVEWVNQGPAPDYGPGLFYYLGTPKVEDASDSPANSIVMDDYGDYSTTFGYTGRIIAMYYANGQAVEVTADCLTTQVVTSIFNATVVEAVPERVVASSPQVQAVVLQEGTLSFTVDAQREYVSTTTLTLRNGADQVAESSVAWRGQHSATYLWHADLDFNTPTSFLNVTDSGSSSSTFSIDMKVDGTTRYQVNESEDGPNIIFPTQPVRMIVPPAVTNPAGPWVSVNGDIYGELPSVSLGPVRYCALMPAAAGLVFLPDAEEPRTLHIGSGALPFDGGSFSGYVARTGLAQEVFGSFDPVTHQFLRDTDNPVCWL